MWNAVHAPTSITEPRTPLEESVELRKLRTPPLNFSDNAIKLVRDTPGKNSPFPVLSSWRPLLPGAAAAAKRNTCVLTAARTFRERSFRRALEETEQEATVLRARRFSPMTAMVWQHSLARASA